VTSNGALASAYPAVAEEADGWDATEVTPMSHAKKQWKCPEAHIYLARVAEAGY
jgi:hypothetical protein